MVTKVYILLRTKYKMEKKEISGRFILFIFLLSLPIISAVSINEFELNPPGPDAGAEWIELINLDAPQNLSGWYIQSKNGTNYSLPGIVIETNGFFVLDNLSGLANTGQNLTLFNSANEVQDSALDFDDGGSGNNKTWQ